jgi:hypothetical protein
LLTYFFYLTTQIEPCPIFYYPQPNGYLALAETTNQEGRQIVWDIAGQNGQKSQKSYHYQVDGWHNLQVRQDQDDTDWSNNYFELLVDSVLVNRLKIVERDRAFSPKPETFYIGYNPDTGNTLSGKLKHFSFDPNDSCWSC